jgi:hypothetical protein
LNVRKGLSSLPAMTLQRERDMIAIVNRGTGRYDRLGEGCNFEPSDKLRPEQRHAVEAMSVLAIWRSMFERLRYWQDCYAA